MDNSKHIIFLKMAKELKSFSKCEKVHVGCIIVNNNRIITTGVNGSASGHENCCDKFHNIYNNLSAFSHIPYYQTYSEYKQSDVFLKEHSILSEKYEIHAEMNALMFALKNGVKIDSNSTLYCTHEPCNNCLKHIISLGINEIFYIDKLYNNLSNNQEYNNEIKITQININE